MTLNQKSGWHTDPTFRLSQDPKMQMQHKPWRSASGCGVSWPSIKGLRRILVGGVWYGLDRVFWQMRWPFRSWVEVCYFFLFTGMELADGLYQTGGEGVIRQKRISYFHYSQMIRLLHSRSIDSWDTVLCTVGNILENGLDLLLRLHVYSTLLLQFLVVFS